MCYDCQLSSAFFCLQSNNGGENIRFRCQAITVVARMRIFLSQCTVVCAVICRLAIDYTMQHIRSALQDVVLPIHSDLLNLACHNAWLTINWKYLPRLLARMRSTVFVSCKIHTVFDNTAQVTGSLHSFISRAHYVIEKRKIDPLLRKLMLTLSPLFHIIIPRIMMMMSAWGTLLGVWKL